VRTAAFDHYVQLLSLFGTGVTGLPCTLGPDTRIANIFALPFGPFQLTGPV
jgi:hypothetical protein